MSGKLRDDDDDDEKGEEEGKEVQMLTQHRRPFKKDSPHPIAVQVTPAEIFKPSSGMKSEASEWQKSFSERSAEGKI